MMAGNEQTEGLPERNPGCKPWVRYTPQLQQAEGLPEKPTRVNRKNNKKHCVEEKYPIFDFWNQEQTGRNLYKQLSRMIYTLTLPEL